MTGLLISFLTFAAVFLGIFALNLILTDIFKSERQKRLQDMEGEFRVQLRQRARDSIDEDENLSELAAEVGEVNYFSLADFLKQFREMTTQAGMKTSMQRIWMISVVASGGLAFLLFWLTFNPAISVASFAIGLFAPIAYVAQKRRQRQELLCSQLPDALDLMSRVLRAGQTTTQGMNAVAEEFKPPVGEEFGYCYEQQNLGLSTDLALRQLAKRTGLMEIKIFVMAVLIQRQSGGNLAELLDKLATVIRKRFELKGMIKSLTAEGRLQATLLIILPFAVWVLLYFANRTYALKLLDHPHLIVGSIISLFIGAIWIKKIVNFDF